MIKILLPLLLFSLWNSCLQARTIELKPSDDWFSVLNGNSLNPGDIVELREGTYSDRRLLSLKHRGTKEKPIIIGAKGRDKVIFKRPDAQQNSFNLIGVQYLTLKGFEITGGSSGIRISADGDTQPKFVTLEGLHIHHIGGPAITCNHKGSFYERMVFRQNHIHHTGGHGEGFYLGCNNEEDGSTPGYIFDSLIENNYIHDLKGGDISQGDGIEIKDGSYGNVICDNVIHDTNYPGIIVYGTDGKLPNHIERNIIWNTGDHGIQAAADSDISNNIVFNTGGDAIHIRSHQDASPGNMQVTHNTIVQKSSNKSGLRIQRPDKGFTGIITVANNAIYAPIALRTPKDEKLRIIGNAGSGSTDDKSLKPKEWSPDGNLNKDLDANRYPLPKSILINKGSPEWAYKSLDFANRKRMTADIGAYAFTQGKQGWFITEGFKKLDEN